MDEIRSIIYLWWRKSEEGFIKFGDHTEPLSNKDWKQDTEKYIQKTAAPRESKTFKDNIGFEIFDVTDFAKKVNKNYKFAKVDNYIARTAYLDKYRLGQTDLFKLPKFEIDREEFIDKVKEVIYGGNNVECTIPITTDFTISDIKDLQENKLKTFDFPEENKENDVLALIKFFEASNILIISKSPLFEELIKKYYEFNSYIIGHNGIVDGRYTFASKKLMILDKEIEDQSNYDFIFNDYKSTIILNVLL